MTIECQLCKEHLSDEKMLGRHIHYYHKDWTKERYYESYIGRSDCAVCNSKTKFINLVKGFSEVCSQSCSAKRQWQNADPSRRENNSKRFKENNPGKPGARKGKKNKLPYPKTEKVLARLAKQHKVNWTSESRHSEETKQKMRDTWEQKMESGYKPGRRSGAAMVSDVNDIPPGYKIYRKIKFNNEILKSTFGITYESDEYSYIYSIVKEDA